MRRKFPIVYHGFWKDIPYLTPGNARYPSATYKVDTYLIARDGGRMNGAHVCSQYILTMPRSAEVKSNLENRNCAAFYKGIEICDYQK